MELRPATSEEFDEFSRAALSAFHREYTDEDRDHYEPLDEPERSLAWFDGERDEARDELRTHAMTSAIAAITATIAAIAA